jgi:hypothetical protein
LRKRLWILCVVAGILTPIGFVPSILVIATFLAVLPAVVLILAPYAFLVSLTILLVDSLSPQRQSSSKPTIAFALAGCVLALALAAAWFNHGLEQQVQALTKEDHDSNEALTGGRNIAIQFVTNGRARLKRELPKPLTGQIGQQDENANPSVIPPPAVKQYCERVCLHLLFEGQADSVIVSSISFREGDPAPPNLEEIGMRFHLAPSGCRNPDIKTDDFTAPPYRLFERGTEADFADQVHAHIVAGQCVVGEPARLSEAQIIVQENPHVLPPENGSNYPVAKNVLHLNLPPDGASRLSIYRVRDGNPEEVFRQTQVDAYPLLPVLLLGPVFTGEGGIGISEGFLRHHHAYSEYNLRDVLKAKLGFDIEPMER